MAPVQVEGVEGLKALRRAANRGLILQRQGTDGRRYVAVAAEGWRLLQPREQ